MADTSLAFTYSEQSSHIIEGIVTAHADLIAPLREQITSLYTSNIALPGTTGKLPLEYVRSYFVKEIKLDLEHFLFKHFVLNYLLAELTKHKMILTTWPRLANVTSNDEQDSISFSFTFSQMPDIPLKEWKHFVFKAPPRKNYKDLDKQVTSFIKTETSLYRKQEKTRSEGGDWVHLKVELVNTSGKEILPEQAQFYWIHLSQEHLSNSLQEQCVNKDEGEVFIANSFPFVSNTQETFDEPCKFKITVARIVKGSHLSIEFFKGTFKLRTRAEIHAKLIEVFSYRNDISQRRAIIEELFHLLFTKHRFEIPKHVVTRKKEIILENLKQQPDYHVYKSHKNFSEHVEMLAEKIVKEEIFIDRIAHKDNISVTNDDIAQYLHFLTNPRLREFIYFKPLVDAIEEVDTPLHEAVLAQAVLREKTLNYVIYHLS